MINKKHNLKYKIIETAEKGFFVKKRFLFFFWVPMTEIEFEPCSDDTVRGNHVIWYSYRTQCAAENAIAHDERYPRRWNGHMVAYGNNLYVDLSSAKKVDGETRYERWGRSMAYLAKQIDEYDINKQIKRT